jgi:hypothetical protein
MPYELRQVSKRPSRWVVITVATGKPHSKEGMSKKKAQAQLRVLDAALQKGGRAPHPRDETERPGRPVPPPGLVQNLHLIMDILYDLSNAIGYGDEWVHTYNQVRATLPELHMPPPPRRSCSRRRR